MANPREIPQTHIAIARKCRGLYLIFRQHILSKTAEGIEKSSIIITLVMEVYVKAYTINMVAEVSTREHMNSFQMATSVYFPR